MCLRASDVAFLAGGWTEVWIYGEGYQDSCWLYYSGDLSCYVGSLLSDMELAGFKEMV